MDTNNALIVTGSNCKCINNIHCKWALQGLSYLVGEQTDAITKLIF